MSENPVTDEDVVLRLEDAGRKYIAAERALEEAVAERDRAVIAASDRGFPRRYVAQAAGVSPGRVQQILTARNQPDRSRDVFSSSVSFLDGDVMVVHGSPGVVRRNLELARRLRERCKVMLEPDLEEAWVDPTIVKLLQAFEGDVRRANEHRAE